jgi:hypothetical protein
MEREHLIIVAILALVLYMLMKHSGDCNCSGCMKDKMVNMPAHIRYQETMQPSIFPGHIRTRRFEATDCNNAPCSECSGYNCKPGEHIRVRYSDKYIGAGQHIKQHIRYDSRQGMFNGMFSGSPQRIREGFCSTDAGCESAPGGCCM